MILKTLLSAAIVTNLVTSDHVHDHRRYGNLLGSFPSDSRNGIKGTIYAPDDKTFIITGFSYDGSDNTTEFQVGFTNSGPLVLKYGPSFAEGKIKLIRMFDNETVLLHSDKRINLNNMLDISVYGGNGAIHGAVFRLDNFTFPEPFDFGPLKDGAHNVSASSVKILNPKMIRFEGLWYDGQGPDAYFLVGTNGEPNNRTGIKVPVVRTTCPPGTSKTPCILISKPFVLPKYSGDDVTIRLPGNLTVFDIKWLSIYCLKFNHNFKHVIMPSLEAMSNIPVDVMPLMDPKWKEPVFDADADPLISTNDRTGRSGKSSGVNVCLEKYLILIASLFAVGQKFF